MIFKVGTTDFTNNVVIGSYEVNKVPVYDEWEDASGTIHRIKTRDRISGSFEIFFRTLTDYATFLTAVTNNTSSSNLSVKVSLAINNANTTVTDVYVYMDYAPVRDVDGTRNDYFKVISVTIEER